MIKKILLFIYRAMQQSGQARARRYLLLHGRDFRS